MAGYTNDPDAAAPSDSGLVCTWMYGDLFGPVAYLDPNRWSNRMVFDVMMVDMQADNDQFARPIFVKEYDGESKVKAYKAHSLEELQYHHADPTREDFATNHVRSLIGHVGAAASSAISGADDAVNSNSPASASADPSAAGGEAGDKAPRRTFFGNLKSAAETVGGAITQPADVGMRLFSNATAEISANDESVQPPKGARWISIKRGDPIPRDAVLAGKTAKDDRCWVGRFGGEAGKINADDWKMWNFWGHGSGCQKEAGILCCQSMMFLDWHAIKRGEPIPSNAVPAGETPDDGMTYVGRHSGEPGKINKTGDGNMWNLWCHWNGRKENGEVLVILESAGRCPQGHPLLEHTMTKVGKCDGCHQPTDVGALVMECQECFWHLCDVCSNLESSPMARQDSFHSADSQEKLSFGMLPAAAVGHLSSRTAVCPNGTKCTDPDRSDKKHLAKFVHPFDPEYESVCQKCGVAKADQEVPTIVGLFRWLDEDRSGNLSTSEIEASLGLIMRLQQGETLPSVETLDEDGNGMVGFSEFARWAGPRLGLPLGVELRRDTSGTRTFESEKLEICSINGCPCANFQEDTRMKTKRGFWRTLLSTESDLKQFSNEQGGQCTCGHKRTAHVPPDATTSAGEFPIYWKNQASQGTRSNFQEFVPVSNDVLAGLQKLLDASYKNKWTRDRRKHQENPNVPKGYRVHSALRNEHKRAWLAYQWRKSRTAEALSETDARSTALGPVKTFTAVSSEWQHLCEGGAEPLAEELNEWYLFHGCSDWVAHRICETDFHIGSAGKNTGTLYGGGTYMAESITKCDEYAQKDEREQFCVLLCRALGGRVRYTDEVTPNPEDLTQSCIEGPFDSVIGDREKCRGTFKEFVFYGSDAMYPEYIIYYTRT